MSGQRLCYWEKCSSVTVNIHTYGIVHDCAHMDEAIVSAVAASRERSQ